MNQYEICLHIREAILTRAGEVAAYASWKPNFCAEEIRGLADKIKGYPWFEPIRAHELTRMEMETLGFKRWDEQSKFLLLPLWLLPYLSAVGEYHAIDGTITKHTSELDNDNRYGALAYGCIPAAAA